MGKDGAIGKVTGFGVVRHVCVYLHTYIHTYIHSDSVVGLRAKRWDSMGWAGPWGGVCT